MLAVRASPTFNCTQCLLCGNGLLDEDEHARMRAYPGFSKEEDENLGAHACERAWVAVMGYLTKMSTQGCVRTQDFPRSH